MSFRIGNGYDVHRFAEGESEDAHIILAGVPIPHSHTLVAHSDGDVLIHALCDALLGALALGDIGRHFPDTDPAYKGVSSALLLERSYDMVKEADWRLQNADICVLAQAPRLAPHIDEMRSSLAGIMKEDVSALSIKATTTEGLGFVGEKKGIAVYAVVLLSKAC